MTLIEYILENKILNKSEFEDHFSIRAFKVNKKIVGSPQIKIKKGEIISIGFQDIKVK